MDSAIVQTRKAGDYAMAIETVIPLGASVEEALISLRQKHIQQKIIYFYVGDERHKLKGDECKKLSQSQIQS